MENLVSASLLAADFSRLGDEMKKVEASGADWLHFDVMDGSFVPNISFGEPVLASVRGLLSLPIDVHLMINEPIRYVEHYARLGASLITIHYESTDDPGNALKKIRSLGCKAGITVKPATDVEVIKPLIGLVDLILIMTVEPGFGGQSIIEQTLDKIQKARAFADASGRKIYVQADGGINGKTAGKVASLGADVLVSGSYLFGAKNMSENVKVLKNAR